MISKKSETCQQDTANGGIKVKVRIIGAGAMGMLMAGRLFQAGVCVELVTRTIGQANQIRAEGLKLSDIGLQSEGTGAILKVPALAMEELGQRKSVKPSNNMNPEAGTDDPDVIMLMVKQTSITDDLAFELSKQLIPSSRLVCFQNGIGHIDRLSRYNSLAQIWIAITTDGAFKQTDHHVRHTGKGTTWLGPALSNASTMEMESVQNLQNLLNHAGFSSMMSNNINSKVWNKLLINAVINPVTAILHVRNGALPRTPAVLPLMRSLLDEASLLADRLGVELAADLWEQILLVCERTADNHSSMLQDVMAGRTTEIEAITGGLIQAASGLDLQLPTHSVIYAMVRSIEQQMEII
ncbi:2-dehydropantoate 2-reductase [Paenibacillus sp. FSL H7-0331]|uniref:ketopantoate reductase family protein n=1 Tax=Paenibacillus sp. FSL H7-0331 TaxID=1920421 RepID=UPI0030F8BA65